MQWGSPLVVQVSGTATDLWFEGYEGSEPFVGKGEARWNVPLIVMPGLSWVDYFVDVCAGGFGAAP